MTTSCRRAGPTGEAALRQPNDGRSRHLERVLPPFQLADADTLHERIPVALAYPTWWSTTLVIVVLGWRWLRRVR